MSDIASGGGDAPILVHEDASRSESGSASGASSGKRRTALELAIEAGDWEEAIGYFDRFILYEDQIVDFFRSDRVLAWGLVPTLNPEDLLREDAESLAARFFDQVDRVAALGIETAAVLSQSLITPSCGAGSLTLDLAEKVLTLTRDVSEKIRKEVDLW